MDLLTKARLAFEHGGIWMWPIMVAQIISLAIIIDRIFVLYFNRSTGQVEMAAPFEESIRRGDIKKVIESAGLISKKFGLGGVIHAGALAVQHLGGKDEIQGKMDEVLLEENMKLEKRIGFLAMIGNVATLTGLLGTITGMIKSFAAVAEVSHAEKATLLSAGISEAMNCTAYGLIVAIPALVMYAVLQNRANVIADDLNRSALKVFNWLSYAYEPVGFKSYQGNRNISGETNA